MSILKILTYPDPRLKQISKPVNLFDEEIREFISDLEETMLASPGGVGIAAPQVGRFQQIIIVDVSSKPNIKHHGKMILINPRIVSQSGKSIGKEGCLSVPEYIGNVERAKFITLTAKDPFGRTQNFKMERYEARAVLHEMDHLSGLLFLDRLISRRDLFRRKIQKDFYTNIPKSE